MVLGGLSEFSLPSLHSAAVRTAYCYLCGMSPLGAGQAALIDRAHEITPWNIPPLQHPARLRCRAGSLS